jgi:hypothetical protein
VLASLLLGGLLADTAGIRAVCYLGGTLLAAAALAGLAPPPPVPPESLYRTELISAVVRIGGSPRCVARPAVPVALGGWLAAVSGTRSRL